MNGIMRFRFLLYHTNVALWSSIGCGHPWYVVILDMGSSMISYCFYVILNTYFPGLQNYEKDHEIGFLILWYHENVPIFHVVIHGQKNFRKNKFLLSVKVFGTDQDGILHLYSISAKNCPKMAKVWCKINFPCCQNLIKHTFVSR